MKKARVDYNAFVKYVHKHFEEDLSENDVDDILRLEEDYNKDSPTSLGKSLTLNRLIFSGKKLNGDEFIYDKEFYTGINLWIADNLKGKSTIFKIVKFALTGVDSIKPDVKRWISEIILEFNVGDEAYTMFIERKARDGGYLFSFDIEKFIKLRDDQKLDTVEKEKVFDFKNRTQLEEKLQEFFFEHFSFYTLKYTSKTSSKSDFDLVTANLTWATYFKSIYLESSNYEYLFFDNEKYGSQGRKIFEMILGLRLTYPINMLTLQRDRVLEEIGKLRLVDKTRSEESGKRKAELEVRYAEVIQDLQMTDTTGMIRGDDAALVAEYSQITDRINRARKEVRTLDEDFSLANDKLNRILDEVQNLDNDKVKIEAEVDRLNKQVLSFELYKDAGSFFSNLEIKICPHCENDINDERRNQEIKTHACSLCGQHANDQKVEVDEVAEKLERVKSERDGHSEKLQGISLALVHKRSSVKDLQNALNHHIALRDQKPTFEHDNARLFEIEAELDRINQQRAHQAESLKKNESLVQEKAVLEFQLNQMSSDEAESKGDPSVRLVLRRDVLDYALLALEKKRSQANGEIISKLEELILKEIHSFGLANINKIEISPKYELIFTQNEVPESFNDLNEGEKLRVKLAFYLSLIQLDIEHNLGRHPRFLIFDSPGSEEMIEDHLRGLSQVLKNVNKRFKTNLQIFVGSALREFSDITEKKKSVIQDKDQFIF